MVFADKEIMMCIVEEGARQKPAVVIKREFVKHFKVSPRKAKDLKLHLFVRVIVGLRKTGVVTPRKRIARDKSVSVEENIMITDNESLTTVNSERYRTMLEDLMWESVKKQSQSKGKATLHQFFTPVFEGKIEGACY